MTKSNFIIGGGFTGLGAGIITGYKVFESQNYPGGICASYIKDGFRFEIGGGHWIFGGDPHVLSLIKRMTPCKQYSRKSAVFFGGNLDATKDFKYKFVDYPLQNHLYQLGDTISNAVLKELVHSYQNRGIPHSMDGWLRKNFGDTLYRIFFQPFHERYTAGLYKDIAPQDPYKTPFKISNVIDGLFGNMSKTVGYNVTYLYPGNGLNHLAAQIAGKCNIEYDSHVEKIFPDSKAIRLRNGIELEYDKLISTIPINKTLSMCGFENEAEPYTSVMVLNVGVELPGTGIAGHGYHWLYIPDSISGFHRIGYYSNVDSSFLPSKYNNPAKYGSLYIEFAFKNGEKPSNDTVKEIANRTIDELKEWDFIKNAIVVDPTWIDVAYTWRSPGSNWLHESVEKLKEYDILSIGRYGKWKFQGIAESLKEGLTVGSAVKLMSV